MTYRVVDVTTGNIVDRNLSYEEALMYVDNCVGKYYVIEKEK